MCFVIAVRNAAKRHNLLDLVIWVFIGMAIIAHFTGLLQESGRWSLVFAGILLVPVLWCIHEERWNPLFLMRVAILAGPAVITAVAIIGTSDAVMVSPYGKDYQNPAIANTVLLMGVVAALASAWAWRAAHRNVSGRLGDRAADFLQVRLGLYVVVGVVSATLAAASLPGFVWETPYERGMTPWMNIGVFQVLAPFSVVAVFALLIREHAKIGRLTWTGFWLFATYVLGLCLLLRGARLDAFGGIIGLMLVWWIANKRMPKAGVTLALLFALYFTGMTLAIYRAYAHCGITVVDSATLFVKSFSGEAKIGCAQYSIKKKSTLENGTQFIEYNMATLGDVAGTLYELVGRHTQGEQEYLFGKTYAQYLLRIFPQAVYPDRPRDLDFVTKNPGAVSGGSFYELAEAFVNFGMLGAILVPAIWTWVMGRIHWIATQNKSYYALVAYGISGVLLFRGTWYQNFSFFKAALAWFLVEAMIIGVVMLVYKFYCHFSPKTP